MFLELRKSENFCPTPKMYVHTPSTTNACSGVNFKKKIGAGFDTSSVLVERRSLGYHCSPCLIHVNKLYFLIGHCRTAALSISHDTRTRRDFWMHQPKHSTTYVFLTGALGQMHAEFMRKFPGCATGFTDQNACLWLSESVQPSVPSGRTCMKAVTTLPC